MDNDDLKTLWIAQLRERIEREYEFTDESRADRIQAYQRRVDCGLLPPLTPEEIAAQAKAEHEQFVEEQLTYQTPFVLSVAERDGVTGPLTDDQLGDAQILSAQQKVHDTLAQFAERLQSASTTMPVWKRKAAEGILSMSQRHALRMDARFANPNEVTEGDLEEMADVIVADLDELRRSLNDSR